MNTNSKGGTRVWIAICVTLVATLGLFYVHFNQKISQMESEMTQSKQLLELKEESIRTLLEQQLQKGVETSSSKTLEQLSGLQNQVNSRLDNIQGKLLNDALSKVASLVDNLTSTMATSSQQLQKLQLEQLELQQKQIELQNVPVAAPIAATAPGELPRLFISSHSYFLFGIEETPRTPWLESLATPEESDHVVINTDWKPTRSYEPTKESDKWIVMTSINGPTDTVEVLCNLVGWKTVIVADLKTPTDWHHEGCVFLSVEAQNALPYKIIRYLPWRSYTRKNIGYLYAIEHGARWILDTDDDNEPTLKRITVLDPTLRLKLLDRADRNEANFRTKVVNPYVYFGRPDIWPRGYPLSAINVSESQRVLNNPKGRQPRPLIQQGLADLDPDVDAVFRLTRPDALPLVRFEKKDPIIINPGTYCPFNSQNTVFHYDAFWGAIIPSSVTMRVSDIWRGYWVQRLLWDVGGALTFLSATVNQVRNPHDYLVDFEQEIPMYMATENFIKLLTKFERAIPATDDLFSRIRKLWKATVDAYLFKKHDADLMEAWLQDLEGIGYKMPPLQPLL